VSGTYRVMFYVDIPKDDVQCPDEALFHGMNVIELAMRSGRLGEEAKIGVLDSDTGLPAPLNPNCDPDEDICPTGSAS
jgi:hypothetical protein